MVGKEKYDGGDGKRGRVYIGRRGGFLLEGRVSRGSLTW
jgi:hypothetical protein